MKSFNITSHCIFNSIFVKKIKKSISGLIRNMKRTFSNIWKKKIKFKHVIVVVSLINPINIAILKKKKMKKTETHSISITEKKRSRNKRDAIGLIIYQLKVQLLTALVDNFKWLKGPWDTRRVSQELILPGFVAEISSRSIIDWLRQCNHL